MRNKMPGGWGRGVMRTGRWGQGGLQMQKKKERGEGQKNCSFCDQWYLRTAECESILRSGLCLKTE